MTDDKDIEQSSQQPAHDEVAEEVQQEQPEVKAAPKSSGMLRGKTIEQIVEREAREEQDTMSPFSISRTLGGVIIARIFHNQIGLVLFIGLFLIIYISFGYVCQKRLTEIERLEMRLKQARYKATISHSRLTEMSRESNIISRLAQYGDSTLTIPNEPPFLIKVNEKD